MMRRESPILRLGWLVEPSPQPASFAPAGPVHCSSGFGPLDLLPESEAARLAASARRVSLAPRQVLSQGELPMENVYLVETGLVSVMAKVGRHRWVESWMVGSKGLVGLPLLLADGHSAHRRVVQIGGAAICFSLSGIQHALDGSEHFRAVWLEHLGFLLLQASQIGACNARHSAMERVTRWLLLASHELGQRGLSVSHDALARALGLRRATVSDCLKQLAARGGVKTHRRLIEVADANVLQSCSCDCYSIITRRSRRPANAFSCF